MIKDILKLSQIIAELKEQATNISIPTLTTDQLINLAIADGGKVCGGYACAHFHNKPKSADIDIYFKDHNKYIKHYAYAQTHDKIDICLYNEHPTEYHDISPSMIVFNPAQNPQYEITEQAQKTYDTKIITINHQNLVNPERTLERIIKYCNKYSMLCKEADLICLCMMINVNWTKHQILSGS